jgi:hypothetical protein
MAVIRERPLELLESLHSGGDCLLIGCISRLVGVVVPAPYQYDSIVYRRAYMILIHVQERVSRAE